MLTPVLASEVLDTVPTTTAEALDVFDAAAAVEPEFMFGTWRGAEVPTSHPMDRMLVATGWWGKQFIDTETVHPLLFPTRDGAALWAFNPGLAFGSMNAVMRMPIPWNRSYGGAVAAMRRPLQTREPKARLRTTRYRGVDSATMIYDQAPVNDVFRYVSDDVVLGLMDMRGASAPYFFVLRRDDSLSLR